jgi:hypothetical protein
MNYDDWKLATPEDYYGIEEHEVVITIEWIVDDGEQDEILKLIDDVLMDATTIGDVDEDGEFHAETSGTYTYSARYPDTDIARESFRSDIDKRVLDVGDFNVT